MYFEEFSVGQAFSLPEVPITKEEILSFAHRYDPLPLHCDEQYAQSTSFGALIAPGVMGFMLVWKEFVAMRVFGDEVIAGKSTHIEWLAPVYAGDILKGEVTVTRLEERNPYNGMIGVRVDITNQNGAPVICNHTETIVKKKTPPK